MADRAARFNNWFQIISNVAIIVGLGLVFYELNQGKPLALVQIASDHGSSLQQRHMTIMGENPQGAITKADLHPADLDAGDAAILGAFYTILSTSWINLHRSSEIFGMDRGWQNVVQADVRKWFTSKTGLRWLNEWVKRAEKTSEFAEAYSFLEVVEFVEETIKVSPDGTSKSFYELLLARD